jgi:hypothetical protein
VQNQEFFENVVKNLTDSGIDYIPKAAHVDALGKRTTMVVELPQFKMFDGTEQQSMELRVGNSFDTTWAADDYQLEPLNGRAGGIVTPATQIRAVDDLLFPTYGGEATVEIVGTFGWSAVPIAIKQAVLMLAQRQFKRYDSPLGVAGVGDLGIMRVSRIDPDVQALVSPFRKVRFA